jgi:ferredoxin
MAYVITNTCTKDEHCIETCPVNCIHPTKDEADLVTVPQLYVNSAECIDCGGCVPLCQHDLSMSSKNCPKITGHSSKRTPPITITTKLRFVVPPEELAPRSGELRLFISFIANVYSLAGFAPGKRFFKNLICPLWFASCSVT